MMHFKLGRNQPAPYQKVMFGDFARPTLPDPPAFVHRGSKAIVSLSNCYDNDTLSNCTACAAGHQIGVWRGNAGNNAPAPTTPEVNRFYSATTGYVPGNPATDNGGDEVTVYNLWRRNGFFADGASQIACWGNVDATNPQQVRQAIWLAEGVEFGIALPDAWIRPFPQKSGFVWDVAGPANPNNGHAFIAASYDPDGRGIIICTWGLFGVLTWAAIAKYAVAPYGEVHFAFSEDCINRASQKADSGFAFQDLVAYSAGFQLG